MEVEPCTEVKVFKWNAENGAMVTPCSRGIWPPTEVDLHRTFIQITEDRSGVFTQGTDTVVTMIVYGEFVDIMEIDANKNVTYDLA